jgi:hypothetical protein
LIGLLECFINLDWGHQLPLGQQGVNLLNELQCGILLVEDERINVADHNWNFSSLEKELQLLPIILLFRIIFGVIETVHLNLRWEVS